MQVLYCENEHSFKVYKYKRMISEEETKRGEFFEYDASLDSWNSFYLNVYFGNPGVKIFKENFDFTKPEEKLGRIKIPAKKDSSLFKNYQYLWRKNEIPGEPMDFYISGDCDIKYNGILEEDRHSLLNLSLMPITGGLNNEKGSKGSVNDVFSKYIRNLPELISNPHSVTGNFKTELKDYKKEIVICARQAYFSLFDNQVDKYFYNVHFFGINDPQVDELLDNILENKTDEKNLAEKYWGLRKDILNVKYSIDL